MGMHGPLENRHDTRVARLRDVEAEEWDLSQIVQ
jgi:hypothetical protein